VKSEVILEEKMYVKDKSDEAEKISDDSEWRNLACLALRRRQLQRELADVEDQYEQLAFEIKLMGMRAPWPNRRC